MTLEQRAEYEVKRAKEKLNWVDHDCWHLASDPNYCKPEAILTKLKDVQTILGFAEANLRAIK